MLIRDLLDKTVKKFGNVVSFYSVLWCAPRSNVKVIWGNSRQVERRFDTSSNSGTYSDNIVLFVLWLFDTRRGFLFQEYIPEFKAMNHEDLLDFQRREEDENVTNRRKINQIYEITGIQNMMRQIVDAIQPS